MSSATVRHQRTGGGQGGVRSALMKEKKKKKPDVSACLLFDITVPIGKQITEARFYVSSSVCCFFLRW